MSIRAIMFNNIEWDTDGEEVNLPDILYFYPITKEEKIMVHDPDFLADILSDNFWFCVCSFETTIVRRSLRIFNQNTKHLS